MTKILYFLAPGPFGEWLSFSQRTINTSLTHKQEPVPPPGRDTIHIPKKSFAANGQI